jgi:serine protease AprX
MPDQVKSALTSTATPLSQATARDRGAGLLNVFDANTALLPAAQTWPKSSGLGTLEAARGTAHVDDNGANLTGEKDIFGKAWNPSVWAPASANGSAWTGGNWNGSTWAGGCWCGGSWSTSTWTSHSWSGDDWAGLTWSSHSWSAEGWDSHSWSGSGWVSHSWSSHSWSGSSWS